MSDEEVAKIRAKIADAIRNLPRDKPPEKFVGVKDMDLQRVLEYLDRLIEKDRPELTRAELPKLRDYIQSIRERAIKTEP
jgi:hypothetical protein